MERYKEKTGVEFIPSVAYHHQGNSIVENKTKTAKALLHSKVKEGLNWKRALREVERICNKELVSDSTGYTAFQVRTGYKYEDGFDRAVRREIENRKNIQKKVIENKEIARERQKIYYNKGKREVKFKIGDRVMVKDNKKTGWRQEDRKGPYKVEKELERGNFLLKNLMNMKYEKMNVESMELCKLDELDEYIRKEKVNKNLENVKDDMILDNKNNIKEKDMLNNRVNVWFNDKNKYFRGRIIKELGGNKYEVLYDDKREGIEEVVLKRDNMTREKSNSERWNIIN
jgi:hypothetical protein